MRMGYNREEVKDENREERVEQKCEMRHRYSSGKEIRESFMALVC